MFREKALPTRHLRNPLGWHDSLASNMCFSRALFTGTLLASYSQANRKTVLILHQLNTKLNTIKSHKIQGTKLKQLQHFLSWNIANIKYSCKSQLYNTNKRLVKNYKCHWVVMNNDLIMTNMDFVMNPDYNCSYLP